MTTDIEYLKDSEGKLHSFSEWGSYPVIYLTESNNVLCSDCAEKSLTNEYGDPATTGEVYWEGEPLPCDECGKPIESAYGPVE